MGQQAAPPVTDNSTDTTAASSAMAQSRGGGSPPNDRKKKSKLPPDDCIAFTLGDRVTAGADTPRYERKPGDPIYRPLKIYTIDPSRRRAEGQTAEINIPFEQLEKGPVGSRFEVVRQDDGPFGKYDEVDLNEPRLLINNGHDPTPGDPVFHHQMVYAVAMSTYAVFRSALGREVSWGFSGERLKLVPHAFEEPNARYVRDRAALEFGWYTVQPSDHVDLPGGAVIYSCLSHDIIVHELTHALLDGLRVRFDRSTNPDVGAFHEAFADLIAILLRFSYPSVVRNIVVSTNGDLTSGGDWLKFVFEVAHGQGEDALRWIDLEGVRKYDEKIAEHDLGTILVSAIIDAFATIYKRKSAPFVRMATGGQTSVPEGKAMPEDLVAQLTHMASRLSSHLLTMCIRAIDYCPPVDITLGEYLRALITSDRDLVPDDVWSYRESLIEAFRKRRIFPGRIPALAEEALLWDRPEEQLEEPGLNFGELRFSGDPGTAASAAEVERQAQLIGRLVCQRKSLEIFGLADPRDTDFGGDEVESPVVESVRSSRRVGPDGQLSFDIVAEVIQRRHFPGGHGYPAFTFRGGATLIIGSNGDVRYVISKNIKSVERFDRQRQFAMTDAADVVHALQTCRYANSPTNRGDRPHSDPAAQMPRRRAD